MLGEVSKIPYLVAFGSRIRMFAGSAAVTKMFEDRFSFVGFLLLSFTAWTTAFTDFPFRNTSLSWEERVNDLVGRLTLDEITLQLSHGGTDPGSGPAPAIPRLGINPYGWDTECLRGDVFVGPATSFPQALGLSATFSTDVLFRMAEATSLEVRAKFNDFSSKGIYGQSKGASCFSPVINIMRHPLWGRNQETYGEDPYLSGEMAKAFVHGLQGSHDRFIRTNAGCKHFSVHDGPDNIPMNRFSFNAVVSERDWRLTFLPQFKACVDAGTYSIMCSYNRINGVPACANKKLLTDILRKEWGFTGYVVSDQDAIRFIWEEHHYLPDAPTTAAAAINAGCNLELCTSDPNNTFMQIPTAVSMGLLDMETLVDTMKPLFYTRFRLGEFDPPEDNPYSGLKPDDLVQSDSHRNLSVEFAQRSFVLLQNTDGTLPLKQDSYNTIGVVGPLADSPLDLFGDYSPIYDPNYTVTPYGGLKSLASQANLAPGCDDPHCSNYNSDTVKAALQDVELVFVCLGTGTSIESEANDRAELRLPANQSALLNDVISETNGNVPIILLLFNAGPIQLDAAILNSVHAVIECFFPAQATGDALFNVLLNRGEYGNPAGRLPFTWVKNIGQAPNITNYEMHNRTYRYWDQESPSFPFGYGLSYTTFSYSDLAVTPTEVQVGESVKIQVTATNTGSLDGDEVIQVYIAWPDAEVAMPRLQLIHFERIRIPAGSSYVMDVDINSERFAVYEDDAGFVVRPGTIEVYVGGQQPNQEVSVGSNVLQSKFSIVAGN